LVLYAKGDLGLLKQDKLGIVGSRKSLPISIGIAKNYAKGLADAGYTLVTGVAQGVDTAVIESTLKANGKITMNDIVFIKIEILLLLIVS
jgi:DNA processing protein